MGYLISPISFRLGWHLSWIDEWFVDYYFYPQCLHVMLKIRLFLIWLFKSKSFQLEDMLYSHFRIVKFLKNVYVNIFFYHGILEKFLENYFLESSVDFLRYRWKKEFYFDTQWYFRILIIFGSLCDFAFSKASPLGMIRLIKILRSHDLDKLHKALFKKKKARVALLLNMKYKKKKQLFFFFFVFLKLKTMILHWKSELDQTDYHVLKQILFFYIYYFFLKEKFALLKAHLGSTFEQLFGVKNCLVNFFVINNYNVNADFLSRYLGNRLKQGLGVKEITNPLVRELHRIKSSWFINTSLHRANIYKSVKQRTRQIMFDSYSNRILSSFNSYYIYQNLLYYQRVKFWFNFEDFLFLHRLNKKFLLLQRKIAWSQKYFKFRSYFAFFYGINSCFFLNDLAKLFNVAIMRNMHKNVNYFFLIEIFCNEFFYKYNQLFFNYFFSHFSYKFFLITKNFYRRFIAFTVEKKLRLKRDIHCEPNNLFRFNFIVGFKLQFLGRFTRKQKTAKISCKYGSTPFSTMIANVDFGTHTVALKNSAANIKVWLFYKYVTKDEYFLKV